MGKQHPSNIWFIVNLKMGLLLSCLNNYLTTGEVSDEQIIIVSLAMFKSEGRWERNF